MAKFLLACLMLVLAVALLAGCNDDPTPTPAPARERVQEQQWPPNPGNSKNCADFLTQREAQDWFDRYYPYYGDVARLDRDGDGFACEALP